MIGSLTFGHPILMTLLSASFTWVFTVYITVARLDFIDPNSWHARLFLYCNGPLDSEMASCEYALNLLSVPLEMGIFFALGCIGAFATFLFGILAGRWPAASLYEMVVLKKPFLQYQENKFSSVPPIVSFLGFWVGLFWLRITYVGVAALLKHYPDPVATSRWLVIIAIPLFVAACHAITKNGKRWMREIDQAWALYSDRICKKLPVKSV